MGYYSTLKADSMLAVRNDDEFRKAWQEAIAETRGTDDDGYLDFYNWVPVEVDGARGYYLEMEGGDWYAKHYADRRLAEFISRVIAPGKFFTLEFQGEDGYLWGYFITRDSVEDIAYVRMVGPRPLDDLIQEIQET